MTLFFRAFCFPSCVSDTDIPELLWWEVRYLVLVHSFLNGFICPPFIQWVLSGKFYSVVWESLWTIKSNSISFSLSLSARPMFLTAFWTFPCWVYCCSHLFFPHPTFLTDNIFSSCMNNLLTTFSIWLLLYYPIVIFNFFYLKNCSCWCLNVASHILLITEQLNCRSTLSLSTTPLHSLCPGNWP